MQFYELNPIPNQRIQTTVEGNTYDFRFRTFNDMVFVDIEINGYAVAKSVRCLPYSLIIPYKHMEEKGNFYFTTSDNKYPSYKDFSGGCQLVYLENGELSLMREAWNKLHG